jgi:hypothetical protein
MKTVLQTEAISSGGQWHMGNFTAIPEVAFEAGDRLETVGNYGEPA